MNKKNEEDVAFIFKTKTKFKEDFKRNRTISNNQMSLYT